MTEGKIWKHSNLGLLSLQRKIGIQQAKIMNAWDVTVLRGVLPIAYLADDEHVLAFDDAPLRHGAQGLADVHLVAVAVGRVDVTVASCYGGLDGPLDWGAGPVAGLQQSKWVERNVKGKGVVNIFLIFWSQRVWELFFK